MAAENIIDFDYRDHELAYDFGRTMTAISDEYARTLADGNAFTKIPGEHKHMNAWYALAAATGLTHIADKPTLAYSIWAGPDDPLEPEATDAYTLDADGFQVDDKGHVTLTHAFTLSKDQTPAAILLATADRFHKDSKSEKLPLPSGIRIQRDTGIVPKEATLEITIAPHLVLTATVHAGDGLLDTAGMRSTSGTMELALRVRDVNAEYDHMHNVRQTQANLLPHAIVKEIVEADSNAEVDYLPPISIQTIPGISFEETVRAALSAGNETVELNLKRFRKSRTDPVPFMATQMRDKAGRYSLLISQKNEDSPEVTIQWVRSDKFKDEIRIQRDLELIQAIPRTLETMLKDANPDKPISWTILPYELWETLVNENGERFTLNDIEKILEVCFHIPVSIRPNIEIYERTLRFDPAHIIEKVNIFGQTERHTLIWRPKVTYDSEYKPHLDYEFWPVREPGVMIILFMRE